MSGTYGQNVGSDTRTCPFLVGDNIPSSPSVYFLRAGDSIKIGFSKNLSARLQSIQSSSMLAVHLIGWLPGDRAFEKAILLAAADHRIRGEWFADCSEVRALVARALTEGRASFSDDIERQARTVHPDVAWAAQELRKISGPRGPDDSIRHIIERVALKIGASYWRAYDIWYERAHQLLAHEKDSIVAASKQP